MFAPIETRKMTLTGLMLNHIIRQKLPNFLHLSIFERIDITFSYRNIFRITHHLSPCINKRTADLSGAATGNLGGRNLSTTTCLYRSR